MELRTLALFFAVCVLSLGDAEAETELEQLVQKVAGQLSGPPLETLHSLQKDLQNIGSDFQSGNIENICNIFRNGGIHHMEELHAQLSPGALRTAVSQIIDYQTKTVINGVCDAKSCYSLLGFITATLRNVV